MDYETMVDEGRVEEVLLEHLDDPESVDLAALTLAMYELVKEEGQRAFEEGQQNGYNQGYGTD